MFRVGFGLRFVARIQPYVFEFGVYQGMQFGLKIHDLTFKV